MTRLCHLITSLDVGGAEQALLRLCRGLAARGYRQEVIVLLPPGPIAAALSEAGIPVHSLGIRRGWPDPRGLWRLALLLRRSRPDVMMTWMYHADLLGTLIGPVCGVPHLIWNLRNSAIADPRARARGALVRILARLSRVPDLVIANSAAGQADHQAFGYRPRRWACIRNGVDTDRFRPAEEPRAVLRQRLGVPQTGPLIGMIGRFEPQKDHATFLAAARRFRASDPRAHFLLAGKGTEPDSPRFRAMCRDEGLEEDAVIGLGVRTDLRALYTACDLATLSSAYGEGTPNVVLEALACGVPVVATDVGDCRALIGPCGEVVPPRDPAALCAAWQRVLSRDLAAAARARAVTTFRDGVTTSTYDELLRGLLAAPSAAPGRTQAASEET